MTDLSEETYFNDKYLGSTLWFGLGIVNALGGLGAYIFTPSYIKYGKIHEHVFWNWATQQAWYWMIGGNMIWYYFIGAVWLFSYTKKPFPQKSMFWSIIVGQALAWVNTLYVNVCFIVGGAMKGGDWSNLYYPLIYDVFFFGFNALDYYLLFPKYTAYYRWREQDWWGEKWDGWLEAGGISLDIDNDDDAQFNGM